jgi:hypothetical protein
MLYRDIIEFANLLVIPNKKTPKQKRIMNVTATADPTLDFTGKDFKKMGKRYIVEQRSDEPGWWLAKSTSAKLGEKPIKVSEKELVNRLKGKMKDHRGAPLYHTAQTPGFL